MFGIGIEELVVILLIVLLFTGGEKLPELSRGLGRSIREIRKGFSGLDMEDDEPKTKNKKSVRKAKKA